jgi:AAA-like domain
LVNDLGRLLKWLSAYVGRKMQLPNKVVDYWDDILGHKSSATAYFEDYLLPNINTPLVLALDEVDRLFENEQVASDFFGMLRGWHESAKDQALWAKLRLIIVHSTEVYISLGIKESPFNVGLSVRPVEFTSSQIDDLSNRHGYSISPENAHNLMELVGGHPYLSRVALFAWSRGDLAPESFFKTAATEQGLYSDHLRRYIWNLQQNAELLNAMKRVIAAAPRPVDVEAMDAFKLESMGLIAREGNGIKMRFRLYELYLRERLNRVH